VEENGKKQAEKLVGGDKGSLTEQQTKGTRTATILIRGKHNANHTTHRATSLNRRRCALLSSERVPTAPLPPTGTQHGGTRYGIPCSVWPGGVSPPGCVPSWIPVKINPVLAEPRTT